MQISGDKDCNYYDEDNVIEQHNAPLTALTSISSAAESPSCFLAQSAAVFP